MTLRQRESSVTHHGAQPGGRRTRITGGQRGLQHLRMPLAGHAVGQHPGPRQARAVVLQAKRQRAKRARHGRRIDHRQHRQAKPLRQIRRTRLAIKQAHDPFDDDQIGILRCGVQACPHIRLAGHPQIHVVHRLARGQLQPHRVQKVGSAFERPHPQAGARMQTCQRSGDGGLALPGSRRGDENGGAGRGSHTVAFGIIGVPISSPYTPCARPWRNPARSGSPCRPDCRFDPTGTSRLPARCWHTG